MKRKRFFFLSYLVLIIYALTCIYPFIWMVATSLKSSQEALRDPVSLLPAEGFHLENFVEVWDRLNFFNYFTNSVLISFGVVIGVIVIYSMVGFALAKINFTGRKFVFWFFLALMFVPGVTITIPLFYNFSVLKMVNTYWGVVLPMINGAGPFAILLFRNYFNTIPHELYECAVIDGLNKFQIYSGIYMPLSIPIMITVAVLNFLSSWNALLWPMLILTDKEWFTLPLGLIYITSSAFPKLNLTMAGSLITIIPIIVVFFTLQKYYISGLTEGAIKG